MMKFCNYDYDGILLLFIVMTICYSHRTKCYDILQLKTRLKWPYLAIV